MNNKQKKIDINLHQSHCSSINYEHTETMQPANIIQTMKQQIQFNMCSLNGTCSPERIFVAV